FENVLTGRSPITMTFDWLLRDSAGLTILYFALVVLAVFTQLRKDKTSTPLPYLLRAVIKAAPALLLSGLSFYLDQRLVALALALVCVIILSYQRQLPGRPLMPLAITNVVIALFVLRWVFPMMKGSERILEVSYFSMLIISNIFASTATVPIFLGSSLWFMSDLSIGLGSKVTGDPANSLDTLGLYDLGLYFLAIGFLNTL